MNVNFWNVILGKFFTWSILNVKFFAQEHWNYEATEKHCKRLFKDFFKDRLDNICEILIFCFSWGRQ
jgi:hypothetical protein